MVAREELDREQRRAAARRTLVVEPAPQQLLLGAPTELTDRAKRHRALAEVRAPRSGLELVAPRGAQVREIALGAFLRELIGLCRSLLQRHARHFTYTRRPWRTEWFSSPATALGPS